VAACAALAASALACQRAGAGSPAVPGVEHARVTLRPVGAKTDGAGITGTVDFFVESEGIRVAGALKGLEPGLHGFHVHEYGDLSDATAGTSAGGHFAPDGNPHGARDAERRHVGDLGNVSADENGAATFEFIDDTIALSGAHSILGRCVVVHAGEDSYTQPSGDAGARVAFGVIGVAIPPAD